MCVPVFFSTVTETRLTMSLGGKTDVDSQIRGGIFSFSMS